MCGLLLVPAGAIVGGVRAGGRRAGAGGAARLPEPRAPICQPGIVTRQQAHLVFAAFDVDAGSAGELGELFAAWSLAGARLMGGERSARDVQERGDSGEVQELAPAGLTVTLGLGPDVFERDRFGLADCRPAALRALPSFPGDELQPRRCGGDVCVQACANDPQVAVHAVRTLARLGAGAARLRWAQTGFISVGTLEDRGRTPRNLFGFREGARNVREPRELERHVWISGRDRSWMLGGTYAVVRRIRMRVDAWDETAVADQEQAIGREKVSGARFDDERFVKPPKPVPPGAHISLAGVDQSDGTRMLRRSYNYFDGVDPVSGEPDMGLFFVCFVRDPRRQFVPMQQRLSERDPLNPFVTYTGGAVFAVPPAPAPGRFVAQGLFDGPGANGY
ncbi:MAG: deferrochelatase/peroxidase EfeB [Solirubrobacteraceae bacterium]|nr:deferrochelatase/peroxidase EfeB [Solirubrobacteraceae bacterium]